MIGVRLPNTNLQVCELILSISSDSLRRENNVTAARSRFFKVGFASSPEHEEWTSDTARLALKNLHPVTLCWFPGLF